MRRRVAVALFGALGAAFGGALGGCAGDPPASPLLPGASITIDGAPADGIVLQGATLPLRAIVRSEDGTEVTVARVDWRSSDVSLASVDGAGLVQGVAPGDLTVSATAGALTTERALSVRVGVPLPLDGAPLTSVLLDGAVRITLDAGAVAPDGRLHLRFDSSPPSDARLVPGTAIDLGPPGVAFGAPVLLALQVPPSVASADRSFLRLVRVVNGAWVETPSSDATSIPGHIQGAIPSSGRYALVRGRAPASLRVAAGDGQLGLPGIAVTVAPTVLVRDAEDRALSGVAIRFAVTGGDGTIVGADSGISDAAGEASLAGAWRLGPNTGPQSLTATVIAAPSVSVTFGATAEAVALVITRQMSGAVSGLVAGTQPRVEIRTASGTLLPVSDGVRAQLFSGSGTLIGTVDANAVGGVATFVDLRVDGVGDHRVRFTAGGSQVTGAVFDVTQQLASLEILTGPAGAKQDVPFTTQPVVRLLDDAGLPYLPTKNVSARIATGDGKLRGDDDVSTVDGVVTFFDLRINDRAGVHTLRFSTSSPTRSILSLPFTVAPR